MTVDNLSWITDGLAIGGSFPIEHAEDLARAHRIAAVIDLRNEARDDRAVLECHGLELLHLPTADLCAVELDKLDAGVAFAVAHLDAGRRVLVHCQHGIGRSALLALCILVERGHAPLAALALAKDRRGVVSPSPAQYEAWVAWLRVRGTSPPGFLQFAAIAYRHLHGTT